MKRSFRPSARLIGTIGEDIIKDMHAAVVELVKNAYDADASEVIIVFEATTERKLILSISDNGHGMDESVVINKWLVPSTGDKLNRRTSPNGRVMQGRKGIGRFATAILGENLKLETVSKNVKTTLSIDWSDFVEGKYLDEILIDISTSYDTLNQGSTFSIEGSTDRLILWNDSEIEYLIKELRKLLTPMDSGTNNKNEDKFEIIIKFKEFISDVHKNETIIIEPLPLLDYYDYRISGRILQDGSNTLIYQNKNSGVKERASEFSFYLSEKEKFSGEIYIDFRIFDRDPEAIENLVYEIFKTGKEKLGKNEAKNLLNDIAGVSIFRNKFRIRPYGDVEYGWLSLDKKRVQMPAVKIGANQISGIIEIQDEEISNLFEKSARDGLKEDAYYDGLVSIINQVLSYVELRRFSFRQKTGKGRKTYLFSEKLNALTDLSAIRNKVVDAMKKVDINPEEVKKINDFIDNEIEGKLQIANEVEKQIAMYQGQATLGKIMNVVMHEVRKPIQWIKNQTKILESACNRYCKSRDTSDSNKILEIAQETPEQLKIISELFNRLNPFATRKRTATKKFDLNDAIRKSIEIFGREINERGITLNLDVQGEFPFEGWRDDIIAAIANIIENAIYWVNYAKDCKEIRISLIDTGDEYKITFWNSGPPIVRDLLDNDLLFEPGVSGKTTENGGGTGLGLAIAGEAIDRNRGKVKVIEVAEGAMFLVTLAKKEENRNEQ